jgi:hypothetical protein
MRLRDLSINDLVILEKDNLPDLFNGPYRLIKSIEDKNELIGSFWVRLTTEISLILRPNLNNLTRARAVNEVGRFLKYSIPGRLGISDAFVVLENESIGYDKILKKHFNFEEIKALRVRSS